LSNICIFCFSGTGMTRYVVERLKEEFENQKNHVDIYNIEDVKVQDIKFDNYDVLGIANPVHSFNAPKIVIDFAKKIPRVESMSAFVISTAGGYHAMNFAASDLLSKILRKKGFDVFYDRQFNMPSNFIIKYDESQVEKLLMKVDAKIAKTVKDIVNHSSYKHKSSFSSKCVAFVGRLEWGGAKWMGKFFHTDKNCTQCGICVNNCPNRNISINKKKVHFKWNCGLCMRCIYVCPKQDIFVRRPFRFIAFDGWYKNDKLPAIGKKEENNIKGE